MVKSIGSSRGLVLLFQVVLVTCALVCAVMGQSSVVAFVPSTTTTMTTMSRSVLLSSVQQRFVARRRRIHATIFASSPVTSFGAFTSTPSSALHASTTSMEQKNTNGSETTASKGFGDKNMKPTPSSSEKEKKGKTVRKASITKSKTTELMELVSSMSGTADDFKKVENLINELEDTYVPAQTIQFCNSINAGTWQLIFSTNVAPRVNPSTFRLREIIQRIEPTDNSSSAFGLNTGNITNIVQWELAEKNDTVFDITGTFTIRNNYTISTGARLGDIELQEHILQPKTKKLPTNIQGLVGLLHRAMPTELFDCRNHGIDTTYADGTIRIVRYTGSMYEGIRDIFIRPNDEQ